MRESDMSKCGLKDVEFAKIMDAAYQKQRDSDARIWRVIEAQLGQAFRREVEECLEEFECDTGLSLKRFREGYRQCDYPIPLWIDQRAVGFNGDGFEGEVYILLKPGTYLVAHYRC